MQKVDEHLARKCGQKQKHLQPCDEREPCDCTPCGCGDHHKTDLVVLIDSSGSMSDAAKAVSSAAEDAIKAASAECPSDLRVVWLVVDSAKPGANPAGYLGDITGILAGTPFTQSHQQYLQSIGSSGPFAQDVPQPLGDTTYPGEEGGNAITDLCNFFDWRAQACKAIFYISDTSLDGLTYDAVDDAASTSAMTTALAKGVVLFAHKIDPGWPTGSAVDLSYQAMCTPTGGSAYIGPVDATQYQHLLTNAICNACGKKCCHEVKLPEIKPCMSIAWGDSKCDHIETDDVEILCITLCNCYANIDFTNVMINYLQVTDMAGNPVPYLPDGTPSVMVVPIGPICFGDIPHCHDNQPTCKSREFVLYTRGARAGTYHLKLGAVCFGVTINQMLNECFEFDLCKS
jgi:hypothetical protein